MNAIAKLNDRLTREVSGQSLFYAVLAVVFVQAIQTYKPNVLWFAWESCEENWAEEVWDPELTKLKSVRSCVTQFLGTRPRDDC